MRKNTAGPPPYLELLQLRAPAVGQALRQRMVLARAAQLGAHRVQQGPAWRTRAIRRNMRVRQAGFLALRAVRRQARSVAARPVLQAKRGQARRARLFGGFAGFASAAHLWLLSCASRVALLLQMASRDSPDLPAASRILGRGRQGKEKSGVGKAQRSLQTPLAGLQRALAAAAAHETLATALRPPAGCGRQPVRRRHRRRLGNSPSLVQLVLQLLGLAHQALPAARIDSSAATQA